MGNDIHNTATMEQALQVLNTTQEAYPAVILVLFIAAFVLYGVKNAPDDGDKVKVHAMRGPGGRPLPTRRKSANQVKEAVAVKDFSPSAKLLFRGLQTAVLASLLVNAVAIILQTIFYRERDWWPGQSAVVSCDSSKDEFR
jgi:hypothetical protein